MAVPLLLASEQLLSTLHKGTSVVVVEEGVVSYSLSSSHGSPGLSRSFRLLLSSFDWSSPPALLSDRFVCLLVSLNVLFCGKLILFSTAATDEHSLFVFFLIDWFLFFFGVQIVKQWWNCSRQHLDFVCFFHSEEPKTGLMVFSFQCRLCDVCMCKNGQKGEPLMLFLSFMSYMLCYFVRCSYWKWQNLQIMKKMYVKLICVSDCSLLSGWPEDIS